MDLIQTDVSGGGLPASQPVSEPVASAPAGQPGSSVATGDAGNSAPLSAPATPQPQADVALEQSATQEAAPLEDDAELPFPADDSDLKGQERAPWYKSVKAQRDHIRSLSNDLKAEREKASPWNTVAEKYGDVAAVQAKLAQLDKLTQYAKDENGQLLTDPQTGLPVVTAAPFVDELFETNRPKVDQIFNAIWARPLDPSDPNSQTYGGQYFERVLDYLGVEPAAFEAWIQNGAQPPAVAPAPHTTSNLPATPEQLAYVPSDLHEAFNSFSEEERDEMLYDMDERKRDARLAERQDYLTLKKQTAEIAKQQEFEREQREAFERQAVQAFQNEVNTAKEASRTSLRQGIAQGISQELASKWKPTENEQTNQALHGFVISTLFNMIDPDLRAISEPMLAAAGVQIEADTFQLLDEITQLDAEVVQREKIAQNPRMHQFHDPDALAQAKRSHEALKKRIAARANRYALQLAQPLMQQLGNLAQQQGQLLEQATTTRPTLSANTPQAGGALPQANSWQQLARMQRGLGT